MKFGRLTVARKRAGESPEGEGRSPRKSPDDEPRGTLFSVKGRRAWLEWLDRLAEYDRSTRADLLDRAVARYAKSIGFDESPPER